MYVSREIHALADFIPEEYVNLAWPEGDGQKKKCSNISEAQPRYPSRSQARALLSDNFYCLRC